MVCVIYKTGEEPSATRPLSCANKKFIKNNNPKKVTTIFRILKVLNFTISTAFYRPFYYKAPQRWDKNLSYRICHLKLKVKNKNERNAFLRRELRTFMENVFHNCCTKPA